MKSLNKWKVRRKKKVSRRRAKEETIFLRFIEFNKKVIQEGEGNENT